jgi:DNA gyrase/topoisomerase IV subunit A
MDRFFILLAVYIFSILVTVIFFISNQKIKKSKTAIISSSATSVLLLPLLLNSVGNEVMKNFFTKEYGLDIVLELLAFATIASLASTSIINMVLDSFNFKRLEKDLNETKNKISEEQSILTSNQVRIELNNTKKEESEKYYNFLKSLKNNNAFNEKDSLISDLESKNYISITRSIDDSQLYCETTRFGKEFLKQIENSINNP